MVSVSRRTASDPGAASAQYHYKDREGNEIRDGVEILRDQDIAEWTGDRYSIVVSPEGVREDELARLADHVLEDLETRYGELRGSAFLHHDTDKPHLHLAIDASKKNLHIPQRVAERAVTRGMNRLEKTRVHERSQARSMSR